MKYILLALGVAFAFLGWGLLLLFTEPPHSDNISVDLFSGWVLLLSFLVALLTYRSSRKADEYRIAEKRREEFIINKDFKEIRMLIENNDVTFQTMIAIINVMAPCNRGLFSPEVMRRHQEFDSYLGYMEGVALLAIQGGTDRTIFKGFWSYYFKRLRGIHLLDLKCPHVVLTDKINYAIDVLISDKKEAESIKAKFNEHVPSQKDQNEPNKSKRELYYDPIERIYLKNDTCINPVERPIWYYINTPDYQFDALIHCVEQFYDNRSKTVKLSNDGF